MCGRQGMATLESHRRDLNGSPPHWCIMSEQVFTCWTLCTKGEERHDVHGPYRRPKELRVEAPSIEDACRQAGEVGWVGIGGIMCCSAECLKDRDDDWERSRPARHAAWLEDYAEGHSHARGMPCGATKGTLADGADVTCPLCKDM